MTETCAHEYSVVHCTLDAGHEGLHSGPKGWVTWHDTYSTNVTEIEDDTRVPLGSDQLNWYSAPHEKVTGSISRNELNEVRSFVCNWLEQDNHGFQIPGGEWGRELFGCLEALYNATDPSGDFAVDK